jgi:radical SAM superfamily enzyme YgiQ (UPF0313 family)
MYQEKKFRVRPVSEVFEDISLAAKLWPNTRRVFLADGDAMILKTSKLLAILNELASKFPSLERVSIYTDARGINLKSEAELFELKKRKLTLVYLGLESGSEKVLKQIHKCSSATDMIYAIQKGETIGIKTSVIALLGIGGKADSGVHAIETARVVSAMSPSFFSALTLTLVPGTQLDDQAKRNEFQLLTPEESLHELARMVSLIQPSRPIKFRTNHASNYLSLGGELPRDRELILARVQSALATGALRHEWMRGL